MNNTITQNISDMQGVQGSFYNILNPDEMPDDFKRFNEIMDLLPLSKLIRELEIIRFDGRPRGSGRNDYPIPAMLKAYFGSYFFYGGDIEELRRNMYWNKDLRILFGFDDSGKAKHKVPPARVFTNLKQNFMGCYKLYFDVFVQLAILMYMQDVGYGDDAAIDGKFITGAAKHKSSVEKDPNDGRRDTDAKYSKKKNFYIGPDGKTKIKEVTYYGYRVHIICCVKTELPLWFKVTPANTGEPTVAKEMIEEYTNFLDDAFEEEKRPNTLSGDKGFDGTPLIQLLKEKGIIPVIDIRNTWGKEADQTKQYKDTDYVYTYDGKVYYVADNGKYIRLNYIGYDKDRNALRYQLDYQGIRKVVRIDIAYDERTFNPIARDSKKFQRIYNGRTSVERLNGRLDRDYGSTCSVLGCVDIFKPL